MKKALQVVFVTLVAFNVAGCAGSLNSIQKSELSAYQEKGMMVEEKKPGLAAALGILPGGGSFYTRHYGLGVVNLLFWPLSVLWDPVNGYESAQSINYVVTKATINRQKDKEMSDLEAQLVGKAITSDEFLAKKGALDRKYSGE
jgi:hypothetical protein